MDSATSTIWTEELSDWLLLYFIEIPVFNANSVDPDQTLHWVYTVCQCPFYGTLGINGLILVPTIYVFVENKKEYPFYLQLISTKSFSGY